MLTSAVSGTQDVNHTYPVPVGITHWYSTCWPNSKFFERSVICDMPYDIWCDAWYNIGYDIGYGNRCGICYCIYIYDILYMVCMIWHYYDMTWDDICDITYGMMRGMIYDMMWYDIICDMISYELSWYELSWYELIYDMVWHMIWYHMVYYTWYDIWYDICDIVSDIIWRDVISYHVISYDMIWYHIISYMMSNATGYGIIWYIIYDKIFDMTYMMSIWCFMTWRDIISRHIVWNIISYDIMSYMISNDTGYIIWHMLHHIWYIWYIIYATWYDTAYMIWYIIYKTWYISCDILHDMIRYDILHVIWYDMIYDMIYWI